MNKRGAELAWNAIIIVIIALIAAAIIIFIFNSQARQGGNVAGNYLNDLEADCDNDGLKNAIDDCPYHGGKKINGRCPDTPQDKSGCPEKT